MTSHIYWNIFSEKQFGDYGLFAKSYIVVPHKPPLKCVLSACIRQSADIQNTYMQLRANKILSTDVLMYRVPKILTLRKQNHLKNSWLAPKLQSMALSESHPSSGSPVSILLAMTLCNLKRHERSSVLSSFSWQSTAIKAKPIATKDCWLSSTKRTDRDRCERTVGKGAKSYWL